MRVEIDSLQGMDEVHDICRDTLNARMTEARDLVDSAAECLFKCDYLQAAVRLQELSRVGTFTETELRILDAASRVAAERSQPGL